jgi:hypothetical protein
MMHKRSYLRIVSLVILGLALTSVASAAVQQQTNMGNTYQCGGYACQPNIGYGYPPSGCGMQQYPTDFCMHWNPPQWVPVQVMVPGRWEYRPVWVQGYPMTLYRPVPGYWQSSVNGQSAMPAWQTQNGWNANPYQQSQMGGGYFDANGMWQAR